MPGTESGPVDSPRPASPLAAITDALNAELAPLRFSAPVTHVYNPLVYARPAWDAYCARFGQGRRDVLLVGMNPGPFGMAQTGIPFGEVSAVRDWLRIDAAVGRPASEHPKRPVLGLGCARSEVSGARLWGWARDRYGEPDRFFRRFFVINYCPLVFMEASGKNRVPEHLAPAERGPLFAACDVALARAVDVFRPRWVIGVGKFAEARARAVVAGSGAIVGHMPHPSPASPLANRGWASLADGALCALGVEVGR